MRRAIFALLIFATFVAAQDKETPKPEAKKAEKKPEAARIAEIQVNLAGSEDPFPELPFGKQRLNYYAFLRLIDRAAHDPELDAVVLKPKGYAVGVARLLEVRSALMKLRRSGKKVFVYKEYLTAPDLVLASVADRISIPESGTVILPGLAIESWYMKELLKKIHISFDVIHIGEYKSAGESLYRDSMSDELRESLDPVLDEFYDSMVKAIAEGRGLSVDAVKKLVDKGLLTPKEAHAAGLVDRIEYEDQFKEGIKAFFPGKKVKRAGNYKAKEGQKIDPNNPMAALGLVFSLLAPKKEKKLPGPKIAIVYCTGPIVSGKSQYGWSGEISAMGSETIVKAIDKARKDDEIKAIVLRINSPGGSGLASDMIWRAIERAKAKKPVIASMGDVAASGGYYIAMNSHEIIAEPQTITGSIGVVGIVPNVDDFYTWVGINPERMVRGKRAAALMTSKALGEEDKKIIHDYMKAFYGDFVAKVAAGRGKTPAEIEPVARGRIWTGRDAVRHGLVDRLGGIDEALLLAREKGGIPADAVRGEDYHVLEYPHRGSPFEMLEEMFGMRLGLTDAALSELPGLRRVLERIQVLRMVGKDRVCAIVPELNGLAHPFGEADR